MFGVQLDFDFTLAGFHVQGVSTCSIDGHLGRSAVLLCHCDAFPWSDLNPMVHYLWQIRVPVKWLKPVHQRSFVHRVDIFGSRSIFVIVMNTNKENTYTSIRRRTKQRQIVLEEIIRHGCHPTADDVFKAVRIRLPRISLSTIYRNLGILVEQEAISAVYGACNELHYDHNTHDHCHIRCSSCGRVCDVDMDPIDVKTVLPHLASGFIIENVHITFTGICPSCKSGEEKEDKKSEYQGN
jgi:Fur family ferric uptake transcriptional regulator